MNLVGLFVVWVVDLLGLKVCVRDMKRNSNSYFLGSKSASKNFQLFIPAHLAPDLQPWPVSYPATRQGSQEKQSVNIATHSLRGPNRKTVTFNIIEFHECQRKWFKGYYCNPKSPK